MRKLKRELKKLQQYREMINEMFAMKLMTMDEHIKISAKILNKKLEIEQKILDKSQ